MIVCDRGVVEKDLSDLRVRERMLGRLKSRMKFLQVNLQQDSGGAGIWSRSFDKVDGYLDYGSALGN